jgi:uncharacterized protein (TIGR03000 family)
MLRHRFFFAALTALGLSAAAGPSQAQTSYAGGGALSGYTSGSQIDRRPVVPVSAYPATTLYLPGYRGSMWSPIFMTSLNYPGVYGSYAMGVANNSLYYREPMVYPRDNSSVVSAVSTTIVPPYANPAVGLRTTTLATPAAGTASVRVLLPADARLYFEGVPTAPVGPDRLFESPPLALGRNYRYDIRAAWDENGREVVKTRSVVVHAGDRVRVDFTTPADLEEAPTLKTRPLAPSAPVRPTTPGIPPERSLSPRTAPESVRPPSPPAPTPERAPGRP